MSSELARPARLPILPCCCGRPTFMHQLCHPIFKMAVSSLGAAVAHFVVGPRCASPRSAVTSVWGSLRVLPQLWSRPMVTRRAACSCGQLHLAIEGEPSRISMCHCLECQRRTGAVLSNQARFRREQITFAGKATTWTRTAESGNALTFHFCPTRGSTVYWEGEGFPGYVAVAIGSFADPNFPAPTIGVWEESRHAWLSLPPDTPPKRMLKQG